MKLIDRSRSDSAIPTSSTADIAFLLLIFFMVTTVFSATKGLELSLPADDEVDPAPESRDAVSIRVRSTDTLVDCRPMRPEQIPAYLEPKLTRDPDKPVILHTEPDVEFRRMVEVYDVLSSGATTVGGRSIVVKNLWVPTRSEMEAYAATFGRNPLETTCPEAR
jgi:biopolymer transport protein ExbD